MKLDIAFSDHQLSVKTLGEFGEVIRVLAGRSNDPPVRFWAFIHYVSSNCPTILTATPPPEYRERVEHVLSQGPLPQVVVEKSAIASHREKDEARRFDIELPATLIPLLVQAFGRRTRAGQDPAKAVFHCRVDVKLRDGRVLSGFRVGVGWGVAFLVKKGTDETFPVTDLSALRRSFSPWVFWRARPWVDIPEPPAPA
jgi:hypothetical protein